jgi:hypothetical protein
MRTWRSCRCGSISDRIDRLEGQAAGPGGLPGCARPADARMRSTVDQDRFAVDGHRRMDDGDCFPDDCDRAAVTSNRPTHGGNHFPDDCGRFAVAGNRPAVGDIRFSDNDDHVAVGGDRCTDGDIRFPLAMGPRRLVAWRRSRDHTKAG